MRKSLQFMRQNDGKRPLWALAIALLCMGLVGMAGVHQVTHFHAPGAQDGQGQCPVCTVLHSALPAVATGFSVSMQAAPEAVVLPTLQQYQRFWAYHLSSRPPPRQQA